MTKIDEAMEKIRARGGIRRNIANEERVGNMSAGELRAILERVFGETESQLAYDRNQQRIGYDIGYERGIKAEQALSQLALSAAPQDVEAEIHTRLAETFSEDWCDHYGNTVGDIIRPFLAVNVVNNASPATTQKDVKAEIREKLIAHHELRVWDCDNDPTYIEVVDMVLTIISPFLAVNDRRALVRLKNDVDALSISRHETTAEYRGGHDDACDKVIGMIDTLLAELPEPEPAFPIAKEDNNE